MAQETFVVPPASEDESSDECNFPFTFDCFCEDKYLGSQTLDVKVPTVLAAKFDTAQADRLMTGWPPGTDPANLGPPSIYVAGINDPGKKVVYAEVGQAKAKAKAKKPSVLLKMPAKKTVVSVPKDVLPECLKVLSPEVLAKEVGVFYLEDGVYKLEEPAEPTKKAE